MKFLSNIDLNKNQALNLVLQNLGTAPSSPSAGQAYFNTGDSNAYVWTGSAWVSISGGGGSMTGTAIVTAINGSASLIDDDNLSTLANDAITKRHAQNTDTGTTNATFQIGSGGPKLKNNGGTLQVRNAADTSLADLTLANETVDTITVNTTATLPASTTIGGVTQANISSAVNLKHAQNTDTGTSNATFQVGTGGIILKNNGGTELYIRNSGDTNYADIRVNNLTVDGTTTSINSNTVNIGDNQIVLNADIATNATNSNGGIAVKRLKVDNTTRADAELNYNITSDRWETVSGAVAGTLITAQLANKYSTGVGNGAATSIVVTHNLNTRDLTVTVRETAGSFAVVYPDIEFTTVNTLTVKFAVAPATSEFTVTAIG